MPSRSSKLFLALSTGILVNVFISVYIAFITHENDPSLATEVHPVLDLSATQFKVASNKHKHDTETSVVHAHNSKKNAFHENEITFLNVTDKDVLQRREEAIASSRSRKSPYSIDILIVGSKNKTKEVQIQRDTWASHPAVRHFILSTEYDDTNPKCDDHSSWTNRDILDVIKPCRHRSNFWERNGAFSKLTEHLRTDYARIQWLKEKADPAGWLCVQRRFATSFTEVIQKYSETKSIPDYLIIADDDTYINLDHIVEVMMHQPEQLEKRGMNQENSTFPTSSTPTVWAGCRVRAPDNKLQWIFPYGGYGTYFSRGSVERLIHPLQCDGNDNDTGMSEFEKGSCNKLLHQEENANEHPLNITIAEKRFFKVGDSLNDVFYKYSREMEHFCLHSDWFLGYMTNFYNISRHTVGGQYWDDRKQQTQENRLHTLWNSELYKEPFGGQCQFGLGKECEVNSTICHYVNATRMSEIYSQTQS